MAVVSLNFLQRLRFAPYFTQLVVTRKCNLSCKYCNEFDQVSDPVSTSVLKERITLLKNLGSFSICLTGGEPTLHPDLPELIRFCRYEKKFFRTVMITNGFTLTPELIHSLNKAGLQDMQISIDGVNPNETTIKVLKSLRRKLEMLKEEARFRVVVSGVVGTCPPEESMEVILTAKKLGFRPRILLIHGSDGQVHLSLDEMKVYREIKKLLPVHFYEMSDYRDRIMKTGKSSFKCRAGSRYLYVDENGLVNFCSQTRHLFSKPLTEYTYEDLRTHFHSQKGCNEKCTLGCVRSSSAYDEWRGQNGPVLF